MELLVLWVLWGMVAVTVMLLVGTLFFTATIFSGAPWVPTPRATAHEMCRLAGIGKGSRVLDMGCGDAVLLREAARGFGARGVGVELNPMIALWARVLVRAQGMRGRIRIVRGNMHTVALPDADICMLYLLPKATQRIVRRLRERYAHLVVVSHGFEIDDMSPTHTEKIGRATLRRYEW